MATFQYIAKDAAGNETRGQIEAGDRASAIAAASTVAVILGSTISLAQTTATFGSSIPMLTNLSTTVESAW